MKSIKEREQELFLESWKLINASFEVTINKGDKHKKFIRTKEIQKKQDEIWKKKCFFENYLKEMEKLNDRENKKK